MFCAICADDIAPGLERRAPLGRNDAMVTVCPDCDDAPAIEKRGRDLGYEPTGGLPTHRESATGGVKGDSRNGMQPVYERPPGWHIARVERRQNGRALSSDEAYQTLRTRPWFGRGLVKYGGATQRFYVYFYAKSEAPAPTDPLANIACFEVKP